MTSQYVLGQLQCLSWRNTYMTYINDIRSMQINGLHLLLNMAGGGSDTARKLPCRWGSTNESRDELRASGGGGSTATEVLNSTSDSYNKKTIWPAQLSKNKTRKRSCHHVKIPATESPLLTASRGLPDAKGVRTRTAVYCPGGSPRL